jgi:hypothetical protein
MSIVQVELLDENALALLQNLEKLRAIRIVLPIPEILKFKSKEAEETVVAKDDEDFFALFGSLKDEEPSAEELIKIIYSSRTASELKEAF